MIENSQTQDRVARTLVESASAVEEAARSMRTSSAEMTPVLEHLSTSGYSSRDRSLGTVARRGRSGLRNTLQ